MSPQRKKLLVEISLLAKRMAALVRNADTTITIHDSEWTIGDMTAHLIISQQIIISVLTGRKNQHVTVTKDFIEEASHQLSRDYIARLNKKFLSSFSQRDGKMLAELLLKETDVFFKSVEKFPDNHIVNTHFGKINLLILLGYSLNHYLLHCSTIAKTLKQPIPATQQNTSLIIPFIKVAMVRLYDSQAAKNINANFVLDIKDVETFSLHCTPHDVKISNKTPEVIDCLLSMDSLTFFRISNGYMSQWKALFTGMILVSGRKSWIAVKLPSLFKGL